MLVAGRMTVSNAPCGLFTRSLQRSCFPMRLAEDLQRLKVTLRVRRQDH